MDKCIFALNSVLPDYLKGLSNNPILVVAADSTTPDLICTEKYTEDSSCNSSCETFEFPPTPSSNRSDSPLSAVDIFTEFNSVFDQVEQAGGNNVDTYTILVS